MKLHIKKGDKVKVLTGKDKGKSGVILRALPKEGKVVVEGIAVAKRHLRKQGGQSGHIVERPMPIDASNVAKIEK
ncbi:50S ribosomal protein L24 [Candidatus Kaiserbacteria bacterium]|nr:50S ribosomal protein L24 [Candidatus Kaiserbacteria bacterium]